MRVTSLRNANAEPRNTMPSAANDNGTNSVSVIDANASENAVQSTTRQKMSQTWFASHTGPIEWVITAPRPTAPLGAAGDEIPEPGAEVGAAEERVRGDPDHQDHRHHVAHGTSSFWRGRRWEPGAGRRAPPVVDLLLRSLSRQRRLIWRSTSTSVTPSPR